MNFARLSLAFIAVTAFVSVALAQPPQESRPGRNPGNAPGGSPGAPSTAAGLPVDAPPVVRKHKFEMAGREPFFYETHTGFLPLKSGAGEAEAGVFYTAYFRTNERGEQRESSTRPLLFAFNGGPGSASVWLHMGALGPKRVAMNPDGSQPAPPYKLVDNAETWLDDFDIVFIDPVGTGYSRAGANADASRRFFSLTGDLQSVAEFIRLYLGRNNRWSSPLYLAGESYGTLRASGLAGVLVNQGIAVNGIFLISSILSYQTVDFSRGNDISYPLFLPSYTAIAHFHKQLPADLQKRPLADVLKDAELFASGEYSAALFTGDRLSAEQKTSVARKLARFTGLSESFVKENNLRISQGRFGRELLREKELVVGRLDGRLIGRDGAGDPSEAAIRAPFTMTYNEYVRKTLGFSTDANYYILGGGIGPWDFGAQNGYADVTDYLRTAFAKNPTMRVFIASGFQDLATPYFAARYTFAHAGLSADALKNLTFKDYAAGHMMYSDDTARAALRADIRTFLRTR